MTARPLSRRWRSVLPGAIALVAAAGCATSSLQQARAADELRDYDVAVAHYMRAVREQPDNVDARLGLERAKLRAADAHLLRGRRLFSQGRYEDAQLELQLAYELNPTSGDIERDLRAVRAALRAQLAAPAEGRTPLESLLARTRDLPAAGFELPDRTIGSDVTTGRQATGRDAYLLLAKLAGLSVSFDPAFQEAAAPVALQGTMTIRQALDAVARATTTFYQVTAPTAITVVPDTPAKRREYLEEVVRVFYLQNADLKEAMNALRVVADIRSLSEITATNAIAIRDTPDRVRVAGRFLSAFDKARPEVVVDVELLEVDRARLREYGLQLASPGSPGISGVLDANAEGLTARSLRSLTDANVLVGGIPALYYRLLKTDAHTRTLANPHLRITDGTQAVANFGEDVPVPRTVVAPLAQGGVDLQPLTSFEYRKIGVNIGITPRTHPNDEITLALSVELSSLAGSGFQGVPTFGSRSVATTIRLKDGETNILAGLIRDDERLVREGVPGLSDIPAVGRLFARNRKERTETDVVVMITPRIVRVLDLSEDDLRPLRVNRDGVGAPGEGVAPPPPIIRGGGAAPAAATPVPAPPRISRD